MGRPRRQPETLIAIESGWWKDRDGHEYTFRAGETLVDSDHPLVTRGNPAWFKPVEPNLQRPAVEQTTAAPGEVRGEDEPELVEARG